MKTKASLFIDGFNFYYGVFRRKQPEAVPADKWLDWRSLAQQLVRPTEVVHKLYYFTATIERNDRDPEQGLRQETYFRALRRVPGVEILYGQFKSREIWGEPTWPKPATLGLEAGRVIKVRRYEEKGSDVNLATRLVEESFLGTIGHAIVVSNDTDLIAPILSARKRIRVSVISPHGHLAPDLAEAADASWCLDTTLLKECRLPNPVRTIKGEEVTAPESWTWEAWPERGQQKSLAQDGNRS